ncbi:unnamed protein product [Adineta ricciae]|uniref:EGF-like domain-containing protein n=1 Tax=Adineta ricciae TaxID=249248 RepID=A0A816DJR2_ADIRI|nr:unnamed protein product [Adineta ricciae]CAF1633888.1 unnamed protein product [Adineta ricciae]
MYHSNDYPSSYDCLYAVWDFDRNLITDAPYIRNYYLIPYCIRAQDDEEQSKDSIDEDLSTKLHFADLKRQNVTSEHLLNWSLPIDIIEEYEMNNESFLYNCSLPWFGSKCQYRFPYDSSMTFNEIVNETFVRRSRILMKTGTCYPFIENCNSQSWPNCLDWREVCDKKLHCPNGEDEQYCEELEMNQCNENEYRCHNGQCIPLEFAWESLSSVDCLDGSDEHDVHIYPNAGRPSAYNYNCINLPIFRCEERTTRYPQQYPCGDGEYTHGMFTRLNIATCKNNRDGEMMRQLFESLDHIKEKDCRQAFYCSLHINEISSKRMSSKQCESLGKKCSSKWLVLPQSATMLGYFQLIYFTNRSVEEFKENIQPDLICFNINQCPVFKDRVDNLGIINDLTCSSASNLTTEYQIYRLNGLLLNLHHIIKQCLTTDTKDFCDNSMQFHCNESRKCISYHRIQDSHEDCIHSEDEYYSACPFNDTRRYQCPLGGYICLSPVAIGNGFRDCGSKDDEEIHSKQDFNRTKSYSEICLGQAGQHLYIGPHRDRSFCELWPCNNPYVKCDKIWDCSNGVDELNCPYSHCLSNEHECYDDQSRLTHCLPASQIVDDIQSLCVSHFGRALYLNNGSADINESAYYPWNKTKCFFWNNICRQEQMVSITNNNGICLYDSVLSPKLETKHPIVLFDTQQKLCHLDIDILRNRRRLFLMASRLGNYPRVNSSSSVRHQSTIEKENNIYYSMNISETWFCNRGILILFGQNQTKTCLCPPSYFGSRCQWQNQRVSLTIHFILPRTTSVASSFQVIIMLINEQNKIVGKHEEILFVPNRDCGTKFHLYLLYSQRPKSPSTIYSIHIDLFDKVALDHWTSWYLPNPFQFLPVNRISTQLIIPKERTYYPCLLQCGLHGRCLRYANNQSKYFCHCYQGYSGPFCNQSYQCLCSNESYCHSPNICVCPLNRFGSKCSLQRPICSLENNPCQKGGLCIPQDDRIDLHGYSCYCKEQYFGPLCQYSNSRVHLELDQTISASSPFVFLHFITIFEEKIHEHTTIIKRIPIDENAISFYVDKQFNLIFVQLIDQSCYLGIVREKFIPMENIRGQVTSKHYCPYVKQYLNQDWPHTDYSLIEDPFRANMTLLQYKSADHPKFYSFICRQQRHLMCFYDERLLCVCNLDRFANCFEFNRTVDKTCQGQNDCENHGDCFQNNQTCATRSICACKDCYYGGKCQISAKGNLLSLDPIIGYYIKPNRSFYSQPVIIKITMGITLGIFILGLIDFLLSILTFHMKNPREVGCGYYLLASSIISFFMIIMLGMKFLYLILSQMKTIHNEFYSLFACKSIDMVLKSLLASNEWIIACVAIERVVNTRSGPKFDKIKSKQLAKRVIPIVIGLILLSHGHDTYYRELIKDFDDEDPRIWCFVRYPPVVNMYNSFITLLHFLGPFIVNLTSATMIIILVIRSRSNLQKNKSYSQHSKEQLNRHKHLLISPLTLVLLGTPRLILSFLSGCMKTPREPWFYVIAYYSPFVPPILTFSTFVLPSETYRKAFQTAIHKQVVRIRSTFFS